MPLQDQLEIIRSNGQVEFYLLNPQKGITNIGRHPENDIVLVSPGVAPFHAVLDHRQKPYTLVNLSHDSVTMLGEQTVSPNVAKPLQHRDTIRINGNTLIYMEGDQSATGIVPVAGALPSGPETRPTAITQPLPATRPEQMMPGPGPAEQFATIPPDLTSEAIILEIPEERERTVNVDQTTSYQLTIINGGNIVATFVVGIAGLDERWVIASPPQVNLFEGERTTVTINITPPRHPDSRAGQHPFAIIVRSPNYPDQRSQRGAVLNINPFYDFTVDELTPKRQTISWFKRYGQTHISITNTGNSDTFFRIEGEDDERACSFEFNIPGQVVGLARQADLQVPSSETISIPISITPYSRRLIGLRKRTYNFTITTTLLTEQQNTPRSLLGDLKSAPLIGPLLILLFLLLFVASVVYVFWPKILLFDVHPSAITAGQDVELFWRTSPPFFIDVKLNGDPVDSTGTLKEEEVQQSKTYVLSADTWLSKIFRGISAPEERQVEVTPVRPEIRLFEAQPDVITSGESVVLSWFVVGADTLSLINNSAGTTNELTEPAGSVLLIPKDDTTLTLKAASISAPDAPVQRLVNIRVTTPTPAPLPVPVIDQFIVEPKVISAGQSVVLQWSVSGADSVSVQPLGNDLPPVSPPITHKPQESTLYVLSATNGQETVNEVQQVIVGEAPTPTPTPTPAAEPSIDLLAVVPEEHVRVEPGDHGDPDNAVEVQINWVVTGDTTNVELTGGPPGYEKLSNLARIGEVRFDVIDTTVFVLTAYNGDQQTVKTAQIQFLDPTPTPEPTATTAAGAGGGAGGGSGSGTPTPTPEITSFTAEGVSSSDQVTSAGGGVYNVVAGSNVNLRWVTNNADTITLVGVGDQTPSGTYTVNNVVVDKVYQLKASNDNGSTQEFLQLRVVPKPPPPAPYAVDGTDNGTSVTLTWQYDNENDIIGFRVYRAPAVSGPFTRIADESQLANSARQYIDSTTPAGCAGYYVTAVYLDPSSGNKQETSASQNSWFKPSCP